MTSLEKLLNEVQVILRQLTQNNDTEFHLKINPYIKQIVELARAEGKKPNAADLGELIQDPKEYVENLQLELCKWIDGLRKAKRSGTGDLKLTSLEKSLNEVQVHLRHLKQNVEIPEVHLEINPHIKQIVELARAEGKKPNAADLGDLIQDSEFLNSLQNGVNRWIESIRKVTRMDRDPSSGTALQEATFWMNIERALTRIQEMRESDEVVVTLEALKAGKRFHATVSFDSDTGLQEMLYTAQDYNQLMKDIRLPMEELLAATNLDEVRTAFANICGSLKKIRNTKYPLKRAIQFFATISTDLCEQIIQLLKPRLLMHAPMPELDDVVVSCGKIWTLWNDEADKMQTIFLDIGKKQRSTDSTTKLFHRVPNRQHKELERRLEELHKFRKSHEQLSSAITRFLRSSRKSIMGVAYNSEREVNKAYEAVKEINYLDLSQAGQRAWKGALHCYREHIGQTETQLASQLREQLGAAAAKNADEMFSIFSRYNALFVRPHIRTAIREYQASLIELVRWDIIELQESILDQGRSTMAVSVAGNYDIPDFSAKVMWLKQNEYLLTMNIKRIENVMGEQWTNHIEGKELKKECELFRQKLDTNQMFNDWCETCKIMISKCKISTDKLFCVEKQEREGKIICRLRVNYSPDSIKISKEIRNLKNMGFRIPFKIHTYAHNINAFYPYAISLIESVRIYESTNEIITNRQGIETLVAGYRKSIHELIEKGCKMEWQNFKLEGYAQEFNEAVSNYQEKVTDLIECLDKIDVELSALDTCQYKQQVISQVLGTIQKTVDQMALNNYSNLNKWIDNLDKILETKLARRVEEAIHVWTTELKRSKNELEDEREANIVPKIQKINLEIRIVSQVITAVPALEKAKDNLFEQFSAWHSIITEQPRISCTRFQQQSHDVQTYKSVLMCLPKKMQIMNAAYEAIDSVVKKTEDYVNQWTRYQSLWDLQSEVFFEQLGSDLNSWMQALMEIKKSRAMVDSPESQHQIFPFVVDYTRVQQKIALKYDYWQREVQQKFGIQLGIQMENFYADISKARYVLENTTDTMALNTHMENLKKQLKTSQDELNKFVAGQKLLTINRYNFPASWLYAEQVEGEWSALRDILNRKDVSIQSQVPNLQTKIMEEDKLPENHTNDINKSKPIQGTQHQKTTNSEDKFKHLKEKRANIIKARNARKINDSSMTNVNLNDSSMMNVSLQSTNKQEMEIDELKKEMREMDKKFHQLIGSIQQRHNALLQQYEQRIEHLEKMMTQQNGPGQSNTSPCSTNESIVVLDEDSPPAATTNSAYDEPSKSMTTPSGTAGKGEEGN